MIGNVFEYLGNPSLGLYWLKGRVRNSNNSCKDLTIL